MFCGELQHIALLHLLAKGHVTMGNLELHPLASVFTFKFFALVSNHTIHADCKHLHARITLTVTGI